MTLMLIPRTRITHGTTNVFADLSYPNAAERQTKTRLALAVNKVVSRNEFKREILSATREARVVFKARLFGTPEVLSNKGRQL